MKVLGKKFHILSGTAFMLLGFALFGASATFYLDPVQPVNFDRVKSSAIETCASSFRGESTYMGMTTEVDGDKVFVTAYGIEEWEGKMNMASHIVSSCSGMSMRKFCFGESCDIAKLTGDKTKPTFHTGMFMSLEFDKKNIDPRVELNLD